MSTGNSDMRKAQLDKAEREHLETVVTDLRELVEAEIEYELEHQYDLTEREGGEDLTEEMQSTRAQLVEAIEHENPGEKSWTWCYEQYVGGVGYTFINRIAALRCMEVRGFIEQPVTQIGDSGITPAAERVLGERFDVGPDQALIIAFEEISERLNDEIELLFDTNSPYTVLSLDSDLFESAIKELDEVSDAVWRADDVLGWVYEYYNVGLLDDLRSKGDREGLEPEDVPAANQFYTPHWVVRMLTDNSLGKLYLEHTGELQDVVDTQQSFTPDERKNRPLSPDESPDIADFCTYLVPSEEEGEPTDFDHPKELRVIDPACGSGHFLLYAFDVLERIWRAETSLPDKEIPRKILQHNLYGVDLDMRACQLAAFNLYLKGRTRAEVEGANGFDMPEVGIVCADASVADIEGVEAVFDEVAGEDPEVEAALRQILDAFEEVHGLGSLLDVRGTLGDLFEDDNEADGVQISLSDDPRESHSLGQVLRNLSEAIEEQQNGDSFLAQDLRSFVRLLDVLAQNYDVALMNPPYGAHGRMPDIVQEYVGEMYEFKEEYYIAFYEVCSNLLPECGRLGMLIPRSFMFKTSFQPFREDFLGSGGTIDFLAEFGLGILDNATVRTVGTVLAPNTESSNLGTFLRLHDVQASKKEETFINSAFDQQESDIKRRYSVDAEEFIQVPGSPITYWTPAEVRRLHQSSQKLDSETANIDGESVATIATGLQTGDNPRFVRKHWETPYQEFMPLAKGGEDAWVLPSVTAKINWRNDGVEMQRIDSARFQNSQHYGKEGLTWNQIKETGRRFGYYPENGIFDQTGSMVFPDDELSPWELMGALNSDLYHSLFLSLTPERHWNPGDVARIPWVFEDERVPIGEYTKSQYQTVIKLRSGEPSSPYYVGPHILSTRNESGFFYEHEHNHSRRIIESVSFNGPRAGTPLREVCHHAEKEKATLKNDLEKYAANIDNTVFDSLGISKKSQRQIRQEIFLRTSESPKDREVHNIESVPEVPDNIDQQIKDLVHHFAMVAIREEPDGFIPVHSTEGHPDMLARIVEQFENTYGEYAEDRLTEVDDFLGNQSATEEAYPNLRAFIHTELFTYHVNRMENTPIFWKLTTERLVSDSAGEDGFACFLDYHSIDAGLFDRLTTQYLDPRKSELRDRQSAANQRRNNESLTTTERSEASNIFDRTTNALDQIAELESVMQELGSPTEREFSPETREQVQTLALKVATFRAETKDRLEALAELRESEGEEWFQDTFSDGFWEKVQEWRDEWLDALTELENACEAYAKPSDEPVEAHLADLFDYFNWRLKGSDHYSSVGILFMTYYFDREGSKLLNENGEPSNHLTDEEQLLASLATGLDDSSILDEDYIDGVWEADGEHEEPPALVEYKALAEEIDDRCQDISRQISSDWEDRALSEITTAGYRPNKKHGVAINITPLAEHAIVPQIVDEKVM